MNKLQTDRRSCWWGIVFPFSQTLLILCTGASDFSSQIDTLCLCSLTTARISLPGSLILPFSPGRKWSQAGEDGKAAVPFLCHIRDVPFLLGILTAPQLYLLLVLSRMESFFPGLANIRLLWASGKHPGISRKLLPWHSEEHCWSEGQGLLVFSYAISFFSSLISSFSPLFLFCVKMFFHLRLHWTLKTSLG